MRVFIAINFTPEVKAYLNKMMQDLKKASIYGRFTEVENLHLTLAFLGEVSDNQIQEITRIMKQVAMGRKDFQIELGGLGKFVNRGECLYWCGIRENDLLSSLQYDLVRLLKESQFSVDGKPFKPHITLARRCTINHDVNEEVFLVKMAPMLMRVTRISLMKSEHIKGILTYSSLEEVEL